MTTNKDIEKSDTCPVQGLLKMLAGKWKPEIFRLASMAPIRFGQLQRDIPGSSKQSLSVALRELEESGLLSKTTISEKPLHIEYHLTEKGLSLVPVLKQLEGLI